MKSSSPPPVSGVVETALYVADLARAREFHVALFGAEVMLDSSRLVALSLAGASVLLLFQRGTTLEPLPTPGGAVPPHGAEGAQHIAVGIADVDLGRWREHLGSMGVAIESEVSWPRGGRSIYFRDPDGHSIELITPGLWAIY